MSLSAADEVFHILLYLNSSDVPHFHQYCRPSLNKALFPLPSSLKPPLFVQVFTEREFRSLTFAGIVLGDTGAGGEVPAFPLSIEQGVYLLKNNFISR